MADPGTEEIRWWSLIQRRRAWQVKRAGRTKRPWWGRRYWFSRRTALALKVSIYLLGAVLTLYYLQAVVAFVLGDDLYVDSSLWCSGDGSRDGEACDVSVDLLRSLLTLALATTIFLVWRLRSAKRPIRHKARHDARNYVPTARNSIMGEVVGRDELCEVIAQELKVRDSRRPHLLIGGVGAGKTAVIVHLTELLAHRGAVPVPVRLRGVTGELDFEELACRRYREKTDAATLVKGLGVRATADHAWRWLRKEDRIVVLADGLEEAFVGEANARDRDNRIRDAIRRASEAKLPLIMASRPHAPLRDVEAAVTELEPLSEEAAVFYVEEVGPSEDEHRLDWVVENGEVSEAPIYLQVARQLYQSGRLEHLVGRDEQRSLETRGVDRDGIRHHLLKTWVDAVIDGHLMQRLALTERERCAAVLQISALAYIGLKQDSLEVKFAHLQPSPPGTPPVGHDDHAYQVLVAQMDLLANDQRTPTPLRPPARSTGGGPGQAVDHLDRAAERIPIDLSLAATWGEQMRIVEAYGDRVRFQHSIMQAYLGSRFMADALTVRATRLRECDALLDDALELPHQPGREFLLSLVFLSRDQAAQSEYGRIGNCVRKLMDAAKDRRDEKGLDLFAAALEIDRQCHGDHLDGIVTSLRENWPLLVSRDRRGLKDAKLRLVFRFGDVLRLLARELETPQEQHGRQEVSAEARRTRTAAIQKAYCALFQIACLEPTYGVRLAIAEEIGFGGDLAFRALAEELHDAWTTPARKHHQPHATSGAATWTAPDEELAKQEQRRQIVCGWLTPMFVASVTHDDVRKHAKDHLVEALGPIRQPSPPDAMQALPLSREVALGQGFKAAANRRITHFAATPEGRVILIEAAEDLLRWARHWYAQLSLIHALTLWALPDPHRGTVTEELIPTPAGWANRSPRDKVHRWLSDAGVRVAAPRPATSRRRRRPRWHKGSVLVRPRTLANYQRLHPFVFEAGELASRALETRHPERYLWIDETGVVNKVGSRPANPSVRRVHNLWIPPSTGWTALHPRTRRLVADVFLLLNLAERDEGPERERYMERATRSGLPPCLTGKRTPLRPELSIATPGKTNDPGFGCAPGCAFELCPYPPRGEPRREEFGEAFCREQQVLLRRQLRHLLRLGVAPWQRIGPRFLRRTRIKDLREFWRQMADRKRVPPVDDLIG